VSRTKIGEFTLDALRTRQSLVKGERLVRHEMRAVLHKMSPSESVSILKNFNEGEGGIKNILKSYFPLALFVSMILPGGFATLSSSAMPEATSGLGRSKLREPAPRRKIDVKRELSVDSVSVFTLIRTDTTLDHSQKAEKV